MIFFGCGFFPSPVFPPLFTDTLPSHTETRPRPSGFFFRWLLMVPSRAFAKQVFFFCRFFQVPCKAFPTRGLSGGVLVTVSHPSVRPLRFLADWPGIPNFLFHANPTVLTLVLLFFSSFLTSSFARLGDGECAPNEGQCL